MTWSNVLCAKLPTWKLNELNLTCGMELMHGDTMPGSKLTWT